MAGSSRVRRAQWGSPLHYRTITYKLYKRGIEFEACVFAAGISHAHKQAGYACAAGRNPRLALGRALQNAGKAIVTSRTGTFAGYSKLNRRSRRVRRGSKRRG
jgi:hypothetical protein